MTPLSLLGQQPAEPTESFTPPVHIQPTRFSDPHQQTPLRTGSSQSQSNYVSEMSRYMRQQNEAVTAAKDAQVNEALRQLQASRAIAARQQQARPIGRRQPPSSQSSSPQFAPRRRASSPQTQRGRQVPVQRPLYVRPHNDVASSSAQRNRGFPQPAKTNGLQDRISHAIKKTFRRNTPTQAVQQDRQIQLVDHTVDAGRDTEALPVLGELPTIGTAAEQEPARDPMRYQAASQRQREFGRDVVVPSFVESKSQRDPELMLASSQGVVGSGVRQSVRVSTRPNPGALRRPGFNQEQVSVFQNAASPTIVRQQEPEDPESLTDRLPSRPQPEEPAVDLGDQSNQEDARRARGRLEAEIDALEDEDFGDTDEKPKFDDRSCEEVRGLLLNKSITDISLDISPPASDRRRELGTITRSWTDISGNVLATGTLVDLRRGYVILDSGQKLPFAKLSEADWAAIHENWLLPAVCSVGQRGSVERFWETQTVTWHASSLCHKPLYFENRQLERYGHSRGPYMQPIHSTLHFFGSILFLPYNTAINPPNECQYSLGFYRPGNCAPWLLDPIPFSREGIRRQALVSTGLAFIP